MIPNLRSSTLLDRQSQRRADADYLAALAAHPAARTMVLVDHRIVIRSNPARTTTSLAWLSKGELLDAGLGGEGTLFLGVERETGAGRFACWVGASALRSAHGERMLTPSVDLRSLAMQGVMSPEELSLAGLAKALAHWHDAARCCGRCGGSMRLKDGGWKRRCWACGAEAFPRTDPVVIMLIEHPDRDSCLLGRSGRFAPNMYSTLAGFVEPGEDVADAVRRETMEEAGITVGEVGFHSAQPWPFPHSLMIGCIGHATSAQLIVDKEELEDARWFSREESRLILEGRHPDGITGPGRQAIARALLTSFVEGQT